MSPPLVQHVTPYAKKPQNLPPDRTKFCCMCLHHAGGNEQNYDSIEMSDIVANCTTKDNLYFDNAKILLCIAAANACC